MSVDWRGIRSELELSREFVASQLGEGVAVLKRIESGGEAPEFGLAEDLAALYGIPFVLQEDLGAAAEASRRETLKVLFKSRPGGPPLNESDKVAMGRAAAAAADLVALEQELGLPPRLERLQARFQGSTDYSGWPAGKRFARLVRDELHLGDEPVRGLLDLLWSQLGILVIPTHLRRTIAAFSFADPFRGPTLVYNQNDEHENVWVWRFTLAHELCHLLFDREVGHPLGRFTCFDDFDAESGGDPREVRANAFAVHFLMPDAALARVLPGRRGSEVEKIVEDLMAQYGVHFKAMRLHLTNFRYLSPEDARQLRGVPTEPGDAWLAEAPPDFYQFPLPSVPAERRGLFAREVTRFWCAERIDRGFLRGMLRAAPGEPIEALADVYDFKVPEAEA